MSLTLVDGAYTKTRRRNEVMRPKPDGIRYHRNGSAGNGFFVVEFTFGGADMRAVVFGGVHPDELPSSTEERGNVAVMSLQHPNSRWDGPMFEPILRRWCAEASDNGTAHART